MKSFSLLLLISAWLMSACDKDRNRERTGIEDHPGGNTNVSGLDASGPASSTGSNAAPAK